LPLPRDALLTRNMLWPPCHGVRQSDNRQHCTETTEPTVTQSKPLCSQWLFVFWRQRSWWKYNAGR